MCCIDTEITGVSPTIGKSDDRCVQSVRVIGLAERKPQLVEFLLFIYVRYINGAMFETNFNEAAVVIVYRTTIRVGQTNKGSFSLFF